MRTEFLSIHMEYNGGGRLESVNRFIGVNLILSLIIPLIGLLLTSTISNKIADTFISDISIPTVDESPGSHIVVEIFKQNVFKKLQIAFPISALAASFDAIRCVLFGGLIGLNDVQIAGAVNLVVQLFVILPGMYAVGFHSSTGVAGMQAVYCVGTFFLAIFMLYFLCRRSPQPSAITVDNRDDDVQLSSCVEFLEGKQSPVSHADNETQPTMESTDAPDNVLVNQSSQIHSNENISRVSDHKRKMEKENVAISMGKQASNKNECSQWMNFFKNNNSFRTSTHSNPGLSAANC